MLGEQHLDLQVRRFARRFRERFRISQCDARQIRLDGDAPRSGGCTGRGGDQQSAPPVRLAREPFALRQIERLHHGIDRDLAVEVDTRVVASGVDRLHGGGHGAV